MISCLFGRERKTADKITNDTIPIIINDNNINHINTSNNGHNLSMLEITENNILNNNVNYDDLFKAASKWDGDNRVIDLLLHYFNNSIKIELIHYVNNENQNILHILMNNINLSKYIERSKILISRFINLSNTFDNDQNTPLYLGLCKQQHNDIINILIDNTDVNNINKNSVTLPMVAINNKYNISIIKRLLTENNINIKNSNNYNIYTYAIFYKNYDIINYIDIFNIPKHTIFKCANGDKISSLTLAIRRKLDDIYIINFIDNDVINSSDISEFFEYVIIKKKFNFFEPIFARGLDFNNQKFKYLIKYFELVKNYNKSELIKLIEILKEKNQMTNLVINKMTHKEILFYNCADNIIYDNLCVICFINEKTKIFTKCGHYCVCNECEAKLNNKCPICRTIGETITVYQN